MLSKLNQYSLKQYQIEVPVMRHGSDVYLRYTIQAFNTQEDLDKLYDALVAIRCQF
jgi:isopenicillin-N epimerase